MCTTGPETGCGGTTTGVTESGLLPFRATDDSRRAVIRVLVIHEEPLVCLALRSLLDGAAGIEVVADTVELGQAVGLARTTAPDLVLTGLRSPGDLEMVIVRRLRSLPQSPAVVILADSDADSRDAVVKALGAGAGGYLLKDTRLETVAHTVRTVAAGTTVLAPACAARLVAPARVERAGIEIPPEQRCLLDALPAPLMEVLRHVGEGLSNAEIGRRLYLTEASVKNYVSRLLAALHLDNRTQAAILAHRAGVHREVDWRRE